MELICELTTENNIGYKEGHCWIIVLYYVFVGSLYINSTSRQLWKRKTNASAALEVSGVEATW